MFQTRSETRGRVNKAEEWKLHMHINHRKCLVMNMNKKENINFSSLSGYYLITSSIQKLFKFSDSSNKLILKGTPQMLLQSQVQLLQPLEVVVTCKVKN